MLVWRERNTGAVELWNVSEQKLITKTNTSLSNCIPNEDGTRMLAYAAKNLRMWTFSTGTTNPRPITHVSNILSASFNGAGDAVMTVSRSYIQLWDAATGQRRFPAIAFNQPVYHAEFSPDGKMIGSCCSDTELNKCYAQIFDATSGRPITPALNHGDGVLWITFSPDSKRVATASEDFSAVIWDARTGAPLCAPNLHREKVRHAAFSADGKMLATIASDSTIRIWNAETGDPLTPPLPCKNQDKQTIFTRDGLAILDDAGSSRLVRFPGTIPATDDLNDLATLLSGSASKLAAAGATASGAQQCNARWDKLRTRYPALFTVDAGNNPVSAAIPTRVDTGH
jgi:WD40 repeat protein